MVREWSEDSWSKFLDEGLEVIPDDYSEWTTEALKGRAEDIRWHMKNYTSQRAAMVLHPETQEERELKVRTLYAEGIELSMITYELGKRR